MVLVVRTEQLQQALLFFNQLLIIQCEYIPHVQAEYLRCPIAVKEFLLGKED